MDKVRKFGGCHLKKIGRTLLSYACIPEDCEFEPMFESCEGSPGGKRSYCFALTDGGTGRGCEAGRWFLYAPMGENA